MTDEYNVLDEDDYSRTYDEDEVVSIRKGDLRAIMDVGTMSMDFGSGFLDNEQVQALRKGAEILGIDPLVVTPSNFTCQYNPPHQWKESTYYYATRPPTSRAARQPRRSWRCVRCGSHTSEEPTE